MVMLLLESGAIPKTHNNHGRVPLWYAAAEGHIPTLSLLLKKDHDSYSLMDDRKVRWYM